MRIVISIVILAFLATTADARCNPKCGSKALKKILDPYTYSLRCGP